MKTLRAGIDFGTSNCSIGIFYDGAPKLLPLEGDSTTLPSVIFAPKERLPEGDINEIELHRRVVNESRRLKSESTKLRKKIADSQNDREKKLLLRRIAIHDLSPPEVKRNVERVMRSELRQSEERAYQSMNLEQALDQNLGLSFGTRAILIRNQNIDDGFFAGSPKTFLASDIRSEYKRVFGKIVSSLFSHIKERAESELDGHIQDIVIGRPIHFHGRQGEKGNKQALRILERSARHAGFRNIEFLYEPVSAAFDLETRIESDKRVLIIDIGGGTTDCSFVEIGPSYELKPDRATNALGYSGTRIGGRDFDKELSLSAIMPHLGMGLDATGHFVFPNHIFNEAASVHDIPTHFQFLNNPLTPVGKLTKRAQRLIQLHDRGLSYRLDGSAELAKIALSDKEQIRLPLHYLEKGLVIEIDRSQIKEVFELHSSKIVQLAKEAVNQGQCRPQLILLTGGMAQSPYVKTSLRRAFKGIDFLEGDFFSDVCRGLTIHSERLFR